MTYQHTQYKDGWRDGVERARRDLLDNRNIAAQWAKAKLERVNSVATHDHYGEGYVDGYRAELTTAANLAR